MKRQRGASLRPFLQIAIAAEHLAVVRCGMSTLGPCFDVVCVHLLKLERLAAYGALVSLPLVGSQSVPAVKGTDTQLALVSSQEIFVDAAFPGDILVTHEPLDLRLQFLGIKVCWISPYCDACAGNIGQHEKFISIEEWLDECKDDIASERIANEKNPNSL